MEDDEFEIWIEQLEVDEEEWLKTLDDIERHEYEMEKE